MSQLIFENVRSVVFRFRCSISADLIPLLALEGINDSDSSVSIHSELQRVTSLTLETETELHLDLGDEDEDIPAVEVKVPYFSRERWHQLVEQYWCADGLIEIRVDDQENGEITVQGDALLMGHPFGDKGIDVEQPAVV